MFITVANFVGAYNPKGDVPKQNIITTPEEAAADYRRTGGKLTGM